MSRNLLEIPSEVLGPPESPGSARNRRKLSEDNGSRKISDSSSHRSSSSSRVRAKTPRKRSHNAPSEGALSDKDAIEFFYHMPEQHTHTTKTVKPSAAPPKPMPWYINHNPWSKECSLQFTYSLAVKEALRVLLGMPSEYPRADQFAPVRVNGEEHNVLPRMCAAMEKQFGVRDVTKLSPEQFNILFELTKEEREQERANWLMVQRINRNSAFTTQRAPMARSVSRQESSTSSRLGGSYTSSLLPPVDREGRRSVARHSSVSSDASQPSLSQTKHGRHRRMSISNAKLPPIATMNEEDVFPDVDFSSPVTSLSPPVPRSPSQPLPPVIPPARARAKTQRQVVSKQQLRRKQSTKHAV